LLGPRLKNGPEPVDRPRSDDPHGFSRARAPAAGVHPHGLDVRHARRPDPENHEIVVEGPRIVTRVLDQSTSYRQPLGAGKGLGLDVLLPRSNENDSAKKGLGAVRSCRQGGGWGGDDGLRIVRRRRQVEEHR